MIEIERFHNSSKNFSYFLEYLDRLEFGGGARVDISISL